VTPSCQRRMQLNERLSLNRILILVAALALIISGCTKKPGNENATSTTGGGGHASNADASNANSSLPAPPVAPSSSSPGQPTPWEATGTSLKGIDGQTLILLCPPGGSAHSIWGSDIYTSDSSICTAAVHSGLITFEQGGTVTIEMRGGRGLYGSSERNGVMSSPFGSYQHSFVFKTPNTDAVVRDAEDATPVMWNSSATMVPFEVGRTIKFKCPADGKESAVWGTDTYTLDSSVCTAAVHAGKIKLETGGPVTIEMRPGESSYKGSTRNGIKTNDFQSYGSSFVLK
jgi:LCCL domain